ncbi:MAG: hypothetical protein K2H20_03750, partial [Bacilli bacterium]|nr:hypothetical protein [Bacilli bacterium]
HLRGGGCPVCAQISRTNKRRDNTKTFIEKAKQKHGEKYDYSKVNYVDSKTKVCIICKEHGDFLIKPNNHLNGNGCSECGILKRTQKITSNLVEFIEKARKVHGDKYDYTKVVYTNNHTKVCIICPEHGEFWQEPNYHLCGQGCPECGKLKSIKNRKQTNEEFLEKARKVHGDKYDLSEICYTHVNTPIEIICLKHGKFKQYPYRFLNGNGCPQCAKEKRSSIYEDEIYNYLLIYNNIDKCNRKLINPYELDLFIPDKQVAIEFDGLFWHNEYNQSDKNYHLTKTNLCKEKGIRLIHIFEDEWIYKQEIVKSRLKSILGIKERCIRASKCEIREVSSKESKAFLDENHLQGNVNSKFRYGLYYKDELVSLMTFGGLRKNLNSKAQEGAFELLRFVNKLNTTVYGGASNLLKYFIKKVNPKSIISYADKRWSDGNLYKKLGFTHTHDSKPNYFYVKHDKRLNRFNFRKDKLVSEGFDPNKSEHEIMLERGIYRIYDCGT